MQTASGRNSLGFSIIYYYREAVVVRVVNLKYIFKEFGSRFNSQSEHICNALELNSVEI
jgi:hypothetical protein